MFDSLKKQLFFIRYRLLIAEGLRNGTVLPFEDDLYERLSKIYFNGYPLSILIKYLRPTSGPGQCNDRSWFITMAFDDALWVSGDLKDLELNYGKPSAWHFWVEHDGWVYDPSLLYKFRKDVYYKIHMITNVKVRTAEEYKNHEWYQNIINTKIEDLKPGGKDRYHLCVSIPLVRGIAEMSDNQTFKDELNQYLMDIEYNYEDICDELNGSISKLVGKRT